MIPIRDTIPSRSVPVVTWALIAVNALIFFYEVSLDPIELERFVYLFGLVPARYSHPEWADLAGLPIDDYWPFLTSMFLHGGFGHARRRDAAHEPLPAAGAPAAVGRVPAGAAAGGAGNAVGHVRVGLPDADSYAATARSRGSSANANTSSMELTGWKRSA